MDTLLKLVRRGRSVDRLTTAGRKEVRELKRELRRLKLERDILAIATIWFARESGSIPSGCVAPARTVAPRAGPRTW